MASEPLGKLMQHIRLLAGAASAPSSPDGDLLDRFANRHDAAAFAELAQRHGPLVLGVCRRVLKNHHDAEDAFQATFLVLACKAGSIGKRESVGSWLYGVAYRTALKARSRTARRREHERKAADMLSTDSPHLEEPDWLTVLDEELNHLPRRYRAPLVLHHLQGKGQEEAAQELGWTLGQFRGALFRARRLLQDRLTCRGLTFSAGFFATLLGPSAVSATVPAMLLDGTIQAATEFAAGQAASAGAVSAPVAALAKGVLNDMLLTKLKIAAVIVLLVGSLTSAGVAFAPRLLGEDAAAATVPVPPPNAKGKDPARTQEPPLDPARAARVAVVLRVKWLQGGAAKAIAMEEVEVLSVLKNTSGQVFRKTLWVGRANIPEARLPEKECTIYLVPSGDDNTRFWALLGTNVNQGGVSHVQGEKP